MTTTTAMVVAAVVVMGEGCQASLHFLCVDTLHLFFFFPLGFLPAPQPLGHTGSPSRAKHGGGGGGGEGGGVAGGGSLAVG